MKSLRPPRLATWLFKKYCRNADVDDLLGDAEELFYLNVKTKSPGQAKLIFWKHTLSLITSYAVKKRITNSLSHAFSSNQISTSMLKNYLKIAIRNLYQHKYFTLLNTFGLAIGMSISLLLIAMLSYISTYDDFHENGENIYCISSRKTQGKESFDYASCPVALATGLREEFAGANDVIRVNSSFRGDVLLEKENVPINGYFVDSNFLSVFSFNLIRGNKSVALSHARTVVLTARCAVKIFGDTDVVGKTIEVAEWGVFEITGVMENPPTNTHFEFEALASYSSLPPPNESHEDQWANYQNQYVYLHLSAKSSIHDLEEYLDRKESAEYGQSSTKVVFKPLPLQNIVTADLRNSIGPLWEYSGMIVFGVIALIILLPGIFNYTNISIARALKRSKEIGLRKTMGGVKTQIFFQFITETMVIAFLSMCGALLIFLVIRSEFQSMLAEASAIDLSLSLRMIVYTFLFTFCVGLAAGFFPALHFSKLNPIQALKNQGSKRSQSINGLRKSLSVFQFALSYGFILCVVIFAKEYHRFIHFDFGFKKENVVTVNLDNVDAQLFKSEFSKLSAIQSLTLSSGAPGLAFESTDIHFTDEKDSLRAFQVFADPNYVSIFNLKILAGENFPDEPFTQEKYILVNETFLKTARLGSVQDAIGKIFSVDGREVVVRGVLKNFHYGPPGVPIGNFILRQNPEHFTQANLNVNVSDAYSTFSAMEDVWKKLSTHRKFEARFFEDDLNDAYSTHTTLLKITGFLGLLAITISILGLLGMVVYTAEIRKKEVGIRKVLGASMMGITSMLSKDYLKIIVIAIVLSLPITLMAFEYVFSRIPNYQATAEIGDVILSVFILITVGLLTIVSQTYKTATVNPAEILKHE